ncbi:hypothetical protein [Hymenobacter edaphi]|nr:hypothetical protein [Hymenobacter edaphi]
MLLVTGAFPHEQSVVAARQRTVMAGAARPPGTFGRWVNRRTKPIGRTLEKVLPFRLVKQRLVHGCGRCFPADTRISLPGGATCPISELRVGQSVLGWNPATATLDTAQVAALATVVHDSLRLLAFADGRTVTATADHPFWVQHAGWASLAPALTTARYATGPTRLLRPGDSCLVFSGAARLAPTRLRHVTALTACGVTTYTITRLSHGSVFFANGLAVGVEGNPRRNGRPPNHSLARRF